MANSIRIAKFIGLSVHASCHLVIKYSCYSSDSGSWKKQLVLRNGYRARSDQRTSNDVPMAALCKKSV